MSRCASSVRAVKTTMGTADQVRMFQITSRPSRSGSPRSKTTISGLCRRAAWIPLAAVPASTTRKRLASNSNVNTFWSAESSSTTRTTCMDSAPDEIIRVDSNGSSFSFDAGASQASVQGLLIRPVPPAAAESHEQGRAVAESRSLRLDTIDDCLLVGFLCLQQEELTDQPRGELALRDVELDFHCTLILHGGLETVRVTVDGMQGVGDILIRRNDGTLILRGRLSQRLLRGPLTVSQGAAVEQRRGRACDDVPEGTARREHLAEFSRGSATGAGDRELR